MILSRRFPSIERYRSERRLELGEKKALGKSSILLFLRVRVSKEKAEKVPRTKELSLLLQVKVCQSKKVREGI